MNNYSGRILKPGHFVWTLDKYCIGQVADIQREKCRVRFFKSINESVDVEYNVARIKAAYLHPQTRVYVRAEDGNWITGRVVDFFLEGDEVSYEIQFPNKIQARIVESNLRVRCLLPVEDPTAVLAAGGIETQYWHDRRRAVLECLSEARAYSHGLQGLLSASVELLPHQVDVVRRVLGDPVQRYLLADEVGLGKTVEACAIIKQAILDNPKERVVILTPGSLTGQWTKELSRRFSIQKPQNQVLTLSFDQIHQVESCEVDTLVIDEAHNLIPTEPAGDPTYMILDNLAKKAHRLLIISATPILGHERTFLALMHLLDPQTYRLDEQEAFAEKIRHRQQFGRLLLALNPKQRPVLLIRTLHLIHELVPSDKIVDQYIMKVEKAIKEGQNEEVVEDIYALQRHIGDTYRLHQRLVRTRRRDLPENVLAPRTSVLAKLEEDDDDRTPLIVDALDQWRQRSLEALAIEAENAVETFENSMSSRYVRLLEALGISIDALVEEIQKQIDNIGTGREPSFLEDESALLDIIKQTQQETLETRVDFAKRVILNAIHILRLKTARPRLVAFCTSSDFGEKVADRIDIERQVEVFKVFKSSDEETVVNQIEGFLSASEGSVLFCDQRGEEGLNLQFSHGIVHIDLPLAPARIEQRIGRLDRFGREHNQIREIYQWVISPYSEECHPWQAWFELLRDGFNVFSESISEVQFLLDDIQRTVRLALYRRGPTSLRELAPRIAGAMAQERQRLDEQYALDIRTTGPGDPEEAFKAFEQIDTVQHYHSFDDWMKVLCFKRQPLDDKHTVFKFLWNQGTLLPKEPWQSIIPEKQTSQPMTYDRIHATRHLGIRLIRPGFELVDSVERLLQWDDRGTAFATWRVDPRWIGEGRGNWLGFRMVYVLEANVELAQHSLFGEEVDQSVVQSIRRRMDDLLPPWTTVIDVDIEMNIVTDPLLRDILAQQYNRQRDELGRQDLNLGSRRKILYELIGFNELAKACLVAKESSERLIRSSKQFNDWSNTNIQTAVGKLKIDNQRLRRRKDVIFHENGKLDLSLERDIKFNEIITVGLNSPTVHLDSIGLLVVSGRHPELEDQTDTDPSQEIEQ